ncbi:hypothetical protein [Streptacidiphilus jiangxiensis]|uniref:Uncharacterized protein n=1 Tax=Streptacidiphilus jiangxiensis TaxID=235985 RepID=A0A1H7TVT8_STRJI|nr:hypothetical protein [Streptacidiphilus jiangxiensis]SEL88608.1 hypothetical protein SAMN05414137_114223 [Streptacidiphilus jiangxiensis]
MSQSVITAPLEPAGQWEPLWPLPLLPLPQPQPQPRAADDTDDGAEPNFHADCRIAARFLM